MENHTKSINPTKNRKTTKKKSEFFTRNYSKSKTKKMYKGNQKATLKKKANQFGRGAFVINPMFRVFMLRL